MMDSHQDILVCPLTLTIFQDPVVTPDGHTYERTAIEKWLRRTNTSPITGTKMTAENLYPNLAIKEAVKRFEKFLKKEQYQFTMGFDVLLRKEKSSLKTGQHVLQRVEWAPYNEVRPEIILLTLNGIRPTMNISAYTNISPHSNVIRIIGSLKIREPTSSYFLLQESMPQFNLMNLIIREKLQGLDERILLEIFRQISDGMAHLASNGIVHGALNCENVFVYHFDKEHPNRVVAKVSNYGLYQNSNIFTQVTDSSEIWPNRTRYSAPEILLSRSPAEKYSEKSDVYAYGVMMWEAYSPGEIPWGDRTADEEVIRRVTEGKTLNPPPTCNGIGKSIMLNAWKKFPDERPDFQSIQQQLEKVLERDLPMTSSSSSSSSTQPRTTNSAEPRRSLVPAIPHNDQQLLEHTGANSTTSISNPPSSNTPRETHQLQTSLRRLSANSALDKQATTAESTPDLHALENTPIVLEGIKGVIKSYVKCRGQEFFAIETEKPDYRYKSYCPGCATKHVPLNHGFYQPVKAVVRAIEKEKAINNRLRTPISLERERCVVDPQPPLSSPVKGQNKGIEGDSNSCYIDAIIFCMFAYSDVFDQLLYMQVSEELSLLQRILRDYIVNPLRHGDGLVKSSAMSIFRQQLNDISKNGSFTDKENDPNDFLTVIEERFRYAPLRFVRAGIRPKQDRSNLVNSIAWQMFDLNPQKLLSTTVADMFRNSLKENSSQLATIPPYLILIAPRLDRTQRPYPYIVPNSQITLDGNILQLICQDCGKMNGDCDHPLDFYACEQCSSATSSLPTANAGIQCFCSSCMSRKHATSSYLSHSVVHHQPRKIRPEQHKLNLFAVLCIERSHYVAFVKCKSRQTNEQWLFFDSMSDQLNNRINIPSVSQVSNFENWLDAPLRNQNFFEDLHRLVQDSRPMVQKFKENEMRRLRLFRDGAFFFYENASVDYN